MCCFLIVRYAVKMKADETTEGHGPAGTGTKQLETGLLGRATTVYALVEECDIGWHLAPVLIAVRLQHRVDLGDLASLGGCDGL